jgi:uncharacterized membrane protein YgaE (UPF0421/DUF939 family)
MAHHHHFAITKLLLIIGILIGIFYAFYYIKEKYQAYQTMRVYYQKVYKDKKVLKEKRKEKEKEGFVEENYANEEGSKLEKEKKAQKEKNKQNKACSVYFDWEGCEKR